MEWKKDFGVQKRTWKKQMEIKKRSWCEKKKNWEWSEKKLREKRERKYALLLIIKKKKKKNLRRPLFIASSFESCDLTLQICCHMLASISTDSRIKMPEESPGVFADWGCIQAWSWILFDMLLHSLSLSSFCSCISRLWCSKRGWMVTTDPWPGAWRRTPQMIMKLFISIFNSSNGSAIVHLAQEYLPSINVCFQRVCFLFCFFCLFVFGFFVFFLFFVNILFFLT